MEGFSTNDEGFRGMRSKQANAGTTRGSTGARTGDLVARRRRNLPPSHACLGSRAPVRSGQSGEQSGGKERTGAGM